MVESLCSFVVQLLNLRETFAELAAIRAYLKDHALLEMCCNRDLAAKIRLKWY